ncbi:hypothetical protein [Paragemmobacter ruber]|uniref:Uncharacterized protein n=1 Tax=Paragemmobacter ruber TaxID=1985673 RepID=A0ABW9Y2Y5_9RHOB|nr:hypothetical protein [Rhodobacter ruber]NBE06883.1 hypothetical protein [Rhodobacter ruber]
MRAVRARADMVADVARLDALVAAGDCAGVAEAVGARPCDLCEAKHRSRRAAPATEVAVEGLDDLAGLVDRVAAVVQGM